MKYQGKTREELIFLLEKLENEHELLKELYKKGRPEYPDSTKPGDKGRIEISASVENLTHEFHLANQNKTHEITRLKLAEQKLKENEEKYRNVFEYSIVGNSITAIDGRLHTNKAYCDILGYSANELNNIPWIEITHPEDVQANLETINSLLRGEKNSARWEKRYLHKNGSIVWVDINTSLQRDAHGEPLYFITSIIDITSRVQVEEKLTDNNSRLELAMKSANMAWWEMDIRTGGVIFNQRKAEMLGYPSENFKHYNDFMALVHPDDYERLMDAMRRHIHGTAEKYEAEYRILSQSGEYLWFYDIGTVVKRDDQGLPLQVSGLVIDISRRKEAEKEIIRAKEKAEASEILLNETGRIAKVGGWEINLETGNLTWTKEVYSIHEVPDDFIPTVDKAIGFYDSNSKNSIQKAVDNLILNGKSFDLDLVVISAKGNMLNVRSLGKIKKDQDGKPLLVYGTFQDITEQKIIEQELLIAKGKVEDNERYIKSVSDNLVDGMIYQAVVLPGGQIKYTYLSDSVTHFYGCTAEEAKADANLIYGRVHKDDLERVKIEENVAISNMTVFKTVLRLFDPGGNIRWVSLVSSPRIQNGLIYWDGIMTDITELKLAEYKLLKTIRLYNVLSQISKTIVHIKDKNKLLEDVCRIAVEYGNFRMAWIGLVDDTDQMIKPVTFAGYENGYLGSIKQISVGDVAEGRGPSGQAFRKGKHFVCNDFENDPNVALWKDEALRRNYRSSIGLPIRLFGEVIGVLSMYASVPDFFDEEEIQLLSEVATEISYAIEALEIERKHNLAVSSLSVNEKKYREITESIRDVVWVLDTETMHFTYVSPSVEKLRGYTPQEVMALPISAAISPEYHEGVFNLMKNQISALLKGNITSEKYFTIEIEQPCKDGSYVFTEIVAYFLINETSGKVEIHGLSRDISDRKRAEESLRKSEARFHGIFNNLQDAFFQADLSGNISLVSPSALKMFGYFSAEEIVGRSAAILYANVEERNNLFRELSAGGSVFDFLTLGKKKDGTTFWASINVQFQYEDGKISGTEGVVRDVTERKIQEDRIKTLSSAVEQSPVMVVITDIHGLIEYVNPKFCETTGFTPDEVIGQNVRILRSAGRTQEDNNDLWDTILTGNDWNGEFENVKKNGEIYYEAASITPITDEQGNIKHFLAIKEDITEKKQLLSDLIKAKVNAEESDRLKSAFLANMSHEIRTPMNGIMGFIELLKEPNLTGTEQQAYIQVIEESGDRMLNLMNNLIDISRIESGEIKLLISHYNINKQLDNIFNFFVPEANKKGIKLLRTYNLSHAESMIKTDMQKLDAILINLVKNAIKFTRHGSVEFGCTRLGDNFRFFVKDSGVGIDSGYQEIIFDRFRQASESLSRPYEGAGLGLSISKAFIEALGGKIWVDSELGVGSTFYFILPNDINETDGIPVQKTSGPPKTGNLAQELKVLIVEDDETSMNYMEIIAGSFCTNYLKASTGRDAVDIFQVNQDINLILMDIKMPVMDGLEATRLIRQINRDVVIIAQTAYSMVGDKEKALEAGCNDYISKPVNKDQLKELIQLHTK